MALQEVYHLMIFMPQPISITIQNQKKYQMIRQFQILLKSFNQKIHHSLLRQKIFQNSIHLLNLVETSLLKPKNLMSIHMVKSKILKIDQMQLFIFKILMEEVQLKNLIQLIKVQFLLTQPLKKLQDRMCKYLQTLS